MEVTLRKASQLEKALLEAARKLPLPSTVAVSIYSKSTVEVEVVATRVKLLANITKASAAFDAAFEIRGMINVVNTNSGISSNLTEKAKLDALEKLLTGIGRQTVSLDDDQSESVEVLQAQLLALVARSSNPEASRYGFEKSVTANILQGEPANAILGKINEIKQRKSALSDEILTLNMTQKIMLTGKIVETLKEFKII